MLIYVNSRPQEVATGVTLQGLLEVLNMSDKRVAVEVNHELVIKREWSVHELKADDRVEIVSFVGGG